MRQAGCHHENSLADKLLAELNNRDSEILLLIQTINDNTLITDDSPVRQLEQNTPPAQSLNITTESNNTQYEIICLLQDLKTEFSRINATTNRGSQRITTNT